MPQQISSVLQQYVDALKRIYGSHLKQVILYGSYARGDYNEESDIDIMILLDLSDSEINDYSHQLSDMTYDFNYDNNILIMPIAKSESHFYKWVRAYPFYYNVYKDGVELL